MKHSPSFFRPRPVVVRAALPLGVAICLAGLLTGCGSSTSVATGQSVVVRDERSLEHAIRGAAEKNIQDYFKNKLKFAVGTQCNPTTPDNRDWRCVTTVQSSIAGTNACRIRTSVRSVGDNFRWPAPVPFAVDTTNEDCGTLHSELPINLPVR